MPRAPATEPERLRLRTSPKQQVFIDCTKKIRGLTGGRGSGKSRAGAIDMVLKTKPRCLYMVIAPTYGMLADSTLRTFIEVAQQVGLWNP